MMRRLLVALCLVHACTVARMSVACTCGMHTYHHTHLGTYHAPRPSQVNIGPALSLTPGAVARYATDRRGASSALLARITASLAAVTVQVRHSAQCMGQGAGCRVRGVGCRVRGAGCSWFCGTLQL